MIEQLNALFESGLYAKMLKAGLMPVKISTYRDYYLYVDAQVKTRKVSKTQAVKETAAFYNTEERSVWRALKAIG